MKAEFWHSRWRDGAIGFHQSDVSPALPAFWQATVGAAEGRRVLVPLCGKSLDMRWLHAQGHHVVGIELSPIACEAFFREQGWAYEQDHAPAGSAVAWTRWRGVGAAEGVELLQADIFAVPDEVVGAVDLLYDRASLIALPLGGQARMRERLAERLAHWLPAGAAGLLVTLDYPQAQRNGPPFAIGPAAAEALLGPTFAVRLLQTADMLAKEGGSRWPVDRLEGHVFALQRRAAA